MNDTSTPGCAAILPDPPERLADDFSPPEVVVPHIWTREEVANAAYDVLVEALNLPEERARKVAPAQPTVEEVQEVIAAAWRATVNDHWITAAMAAQAILAAFTLTQRADHER